MQISQTSSGATIQANNVKLTIEESKNYTLEDLRRRLINYLMSIKVSCYSSIDIEIMKILFGE